MSRTPIHIDSAVAFAAMKEAQALSLPVETLVGEAIAARVKELQRERGDWEQRKERMTDWSKWNLETREGELLMKTHRTPYEEQELRHIGHILDERAAGDMEREAELLARGRMCAGRRIEYDPALADSEDFDCYDASPKDATLEDISSSDITPAAIPVA